MTAELWKVDTKRVEETSAGIIESLAQLMASTLTYDNGSEFTKHQEVSKG